MIPDSAQMEAIKEDFVKQGSHRNGACTGKRHIIDHSADSTLAAVGLWSGEQSHPHWTPHADAAVIRHRTAYRVRDSEFHVVNTLDVIAVTEEASVSKLSESKQVLLSKTGVYDAIQLKSLEEAWLESGDSYAIDLGGTNMRVLHVVLSEEPSKVECTEMTEVSIPPNIYKGTGQQ
eukprot:scaffold147986_cov34-Tisochrysis_lutea.AAC.1